MKIVCVPIAEDRGLSSPVSREFASAPMFLLVDSATLAFRTIPNTPQRLKDRGCDPCEALEDTTVDLLIVARIEQDTLAQITSRGVPVHGGAVGTAADALAALIGGRLPALQAGREPVMTTAERKMQTKAAVKGGCG
jgi:predicted Fe-Mo cluster-binding NifX family protein